MARALHLRGGAALRRYAVTRARSPTVFLRELPARRHDDRDGVLHRASRNRSTRSSRSPSALEHAHDRGQGADGPQRARCAARHRAARLRRVEGADRSDGTAAAGNGYAITPRFAPTSTPAQLEAAGALWKEQPGTCAAVARLPRTAREIEWVKRALSRTSRLPRRLRSLRPARSARGLRPRHLARRGRCGALLRRRARRSRTARPRICFLGSGLFRIGDGEARGRPAARRARHRHRRRHVLLAADAR